MGLAPVFIMMGIFYFLVIAPARKERKLHASMLESLKRGDEVVMNSGMLATITDIADPFLTVEISKNVKVRVLKSSIAKKYVEPKKEKEESKA